MWRLWGWCRSGRLRLVGAEYGAQKTALGAALLVGVRALELPLTGAGVEGAVAAPGTWLALASVASLLVAAGLMGARATR